MKVAGKIDAVETAGLSAVTGSEAIDEQTPTTKAAASTVDDGTSSAPIDASSHTDGGAVTLRTETAGRSVRVDDLVLVERPADDDVVSAAVVVAVDTEVTVGESVTSSTAATGAVANDDDAGGGGGDGSTAGDGATGIAATTARSRTIPVIQLTTEDETL